MKKKFILKIVSVILCGVLVLFGLAGCGANKEESNDSNNNIAEKQEAEKALKVFEYIEEIELKSTVKEINKKLGIEAEVEEEKNDKGEVSYTTYTWKISDKASLIATSYKKDSIYNFKVEIDDSLIRNENVDFSKYDEISSALKNSKTITYEKFKETIGGVDGNLVEKSSSSNVYRWVNSDGGYLRATFSNSSNKCTFVSGRF